MQPKVTRAGDRGILADFGADVTAAELHARAAALHEDPHVVACVVGQQSLYVVFDGDPAIDFDDVPPIAFTPRTHVIDVDFSGPDLDELLAYAHLARGDFLKRVPSIRLTARYLGFCAGFAYLEGWPDEWRMPRRTTSRNLVPRGSFAIAGAMAGFYPVDSPGGWNLLGRTNASLWDSNADPPNRFAPGDVIEIRPASIDSFDAPAAANVENGSEIVAEVVAPGQLTTIVGARDWKRADYGVSPGGPFDVLAAALANRAAGNDDDAPLLECVLVAPRLRFRTARRAAFCDGGGDVQTFTLAAGEELNLGRFHGGLRGYLAIEGGIDEMRARYAEAPTVVRVGMAIRSLKREASYLRVSTVESLLPRFLGEKVPLRRYRSSGQAPADEGADLSRKEPEAKDIRIILGPHDAPTLPEEWEVTAQLNRVGIRLRPIETSSFVASANLPSCGMQFGTLQWHPDGSLVAMGPDHPVTGGYLQPATVVSDDLWKLAQLAPGERIRLIVCTAG
ncbi:MAG TPA: carboxyltransferase domain-containing protein [Thermoanaerobaculia bacterium]|jgi:KipI family sensor histidine kinase inhibitor|nr:carboxyltransferase domain-containing protein [Thermoanaerobaculia bacterium]